MLEGCEAVSEGGVSFAAHSPVDAEAVMDGMHGLEDRQEGGNAYAADDKEVVRCGGGDGHGIREAADLDARAGRCGLMEEARATAAVLVERYAQFEG